MFHEQGNRDTFRDVEDILVRLVRSGHHLPLVGIAMQIEKVNLVEGLEETMPHSPKSGTVELAVAGDEAQDALTGLRDAPL